MNELQVKTINLTPAIVEFNYDELSKVLDESLKRYEGLTFTEEDATECKKTIAELNKGKKSLDTYRKETKKDLTASVTEFENRCKELNKKFDAVINPLKEQHQQFEENRKEEKRLKVQEIIAQLIEEHELLEKYAVELVVSDSYLAKSKTIKSIREELTSNAEHLKMKQDKEESDKQLIKSTVEVANARYNVNLAENAYVRLLDFKEVDIIKNQILEDAKNEAAKRLREEAEKALHEEKTNQDEEQKEPTDNPINVPFADLEDLSDPFAANDEFIIDPFATKSMPLFKSYEVVGTEEQLKALNEYMSSKGIEWKVIE